MEWVALSIAILGIIYFTINYGGFRRVLAFIGAGLVGLAVIASLYMAYEDFRETQRRSAAKELIEPNQIEISEAKLSMGIVKDIEFTVTNRSPYDLAELSLNVTLMDCSTEIKKESQRGIDSRSRDQPTSEESKNRFEPWQQDPECIIVGEDTVRESTLVPSGQKRAFKAFVSFSDLPKLEDPSWYYDIKEIVAKY